MLEMRSKDVTKAVENNVPEDQEPQDNPANVTLDSIDSIDDLLPPSKLYAKKHGEHHNIDADLDAMLEIDMDDVAILKRKETAKSKRRMNRKMQHCISCHCTKIGNATIWNRRLYQSSWKLGIIGPHGLGVLFTMALLYFASYYFIQKAYRDVGIVSSGICIWFTIQATVFLFLVAFCDPGIVWDAKKYEECFGGKGIGSEGAGKSVSVKGSEEEEGEEEFVGLIRRNFSQGEEQGWRYCGVCEVYQPPKAMHCPDCNFCVDGYDHHCPWMGICIGKNNFKSFVAFNMTWFVYLVYASAWVVGIGPYYFGRSKT